MRPPESTVWAILVLAALGAFMVWVIQLEDPEPMPCDRDEVYVWEDYPTDAACVDATDHEAHG